VDRRKLAAKVPLILTRIVRLRGAWILGCLWIREVLLRASKWTRHWHREGFRSWHVPDRGSWRRGVVRLSRRGTRRRLVVLGSGTRWWTLRRRIRSMRGLRGSDRAIIWNGWWETGDWARILTDGRWSTLLDETIKILA